MGSATPVFARSWFNKRHQRVVSEWILHKIRLWDYRTANSVDHFIANSHFIARRIKKIYGRESTVIYPPVAVQDFTLTSDKEDFYFTASRMVPYKKIGLIVESFAQMPDKKLIVIGDGTEFSKLNVLLLTMTISHSSAINRFLC